MKKFSNYIILLICAVVAAGSFSSCVSDGEDYTIDPQTYASYLRSMSGTYYGNARYYCAKNANSSNMEKYDSLMHTSWTARTDSTITMEIAVSKLDSAIYKGTQYQSLKEAIRNCNEVKQLKALYWIPNSSYVTSTSISFFVNPALLTVDLTYDGQQRTVAFMFYQNSYGGTWTASNLQYSMVLARIYTDYKDLNNPGGYIDLNNNPSIFRTIGIQFTKQ